MDKGRVDLAYRPGERGLGCVRRVGDIAENSPRMPDDLLGIGLDALAVECLARIDDQLDTLGLDARYRTQYAVELALTAFCVDIERVVVAALLAVLVCLERFVESLHRRVDIADGGGHIRLEARQLLDRSSEITKLGNGLGRLNLNVVFYIIRLIGHSALFFG